MNSIFIIICLAIILYILNCLLLNVLSDRAGQLSVGKISDKKIPKNNMFLEWEFLWEFN